MSLDKVQFFGAVDRKDKRKDGHIVSPYPCWYFKNHLNDLKEGIAEKKRHLAGDLIHPSARPGMRRELEQEQERLVAIQKATVKLSGKDKDEAKELYDAMGTGIQDSMFTYTEMRKGFADPHEEARRMKEPIIKVDSKFKKVAENLGARIGKNNKISRDDATRMYQIIGRTLGENTNAERLRRDPHVNAYRSEVPFEEMGR